LDASDRDQLDRIEASIKLQVEIRNGYGVERLPPTLDEFEKTNPFAETFRSKAASSRLQ
jgi:hypothetical protein